MNSRQLNQLRAAFGSCSRITVEHFGKLKGTIANLPRADLEQLADSGIRFVDTAANSVLCDRGVRPESARWDHAVDTITESLVAEHRQAVRA